MEHFWRNVQELTETQFPRIGIMQGSVIMMATESLKLVQDSTLGETGDVRNEDTQKVSLDSLSQMTGFPLDFIKSELIVEGEEISMSDLRKTMVNFLEKNKTLLD